MQVTSHRGVRSSTPTCWRREIAVLLALVALSLQAFVPLCHARSLQRLIAVTPERAIVICTSDGMQVVDVSDLEVGRGGGSHMPTGHQGGKHDCCRVAGSLLAPDRPDAGLSVAFPALTRTTLPLDAADDAAGFAPQVRPGRPRDPPIV